MNPQEVFCPNPDCPARGHIGAGNIRIHARTPPRYRCTVCRRTFSPRAGTPFYRRSTATATITLILTLLAHGCPIAAIVGAFGVQRQTVAAWLDVAGAQCEAVHRHLVCRERELGAIQADEIRVRQQGRVVWLALAMQVATRLWLGGVVSPCRDGALIARLCALIRACALPAPLLVCVDGFAAYVKQITRMARSPEPRAGKRGRCRLIAWPGLVIGQVVKRRACGHVVGVTRRLAHGTTRWARLLLGGGTIQTAYIERLNGTFRAHLGRPGTTDARTGTDGGAADGGDVAGGRGLQLLHAARQPGARADARDGSGNHRPCLEHGRTAALPRPSRSVAAATEKGETHKSGSGADCAVGDMTTVPHTPTSGEDAAVYRHLQQ
jgi:transposase-like protein